MTAEAVTTFPVSLFLVAAIFVIGYAMWEVSYVYKLTASEAAGVSGATLIVILLCLLLLSKACARAAATPMTSRPPLQATLALGCGG
jgi:hypothetical protein